jgi:uncharacterized membrane protein YbaN (DUF454 family)
VHGPAIRLPYLALGSVCLALGLVGAFVPLLPTTVFLIVATWAFSRSSPVMHRAIVEHPRLGPPIRRWYAHRCLSPTAKRAAAGAIALSFVVSAFTLRESPLGVLALGLVLASVVAYLLTRPNCRPDD